MYRSRQVIICHLAESSGRRPIAIYCAAYETESIFSLFDPILFLDSKSFRKSDSIISYFTHQSKGYSNDKSKSEKLLNPMLVEDTGRRCLTARQKDWLLELAGYEPAGRNNLNDTYTVFNI